MNKNKLEESLLNIDWYTDDWSEPTKEVDLRENLTKEKHLTSRKRLTEGKYFAKGKHLTKRKHLTEGKHKEVPFDSLGHQFECEFNFLGEDQTAKDFIGHTRIVPFDWLNFSKDLNTLSINLSTCNPALLDQKVSEITEVVERYRTKGEYDCSVEFIKNAAGKVVEAVIDIEGFYDLPADKDCLLGERKQYRRYHAERIKAEKEAALKAEQETVKEAVEEEEVKEDTESKIIEEPASIGVEEPVINKAIDKKEQETTLIAILSTLINSEFSAIQEYKQAVDAIELNDADESIVALLHDIAEEEMIHVGELQKALEAVSPKLAEKTQEGKDEAEEKLGTTTESEVVEDEIIEEACKN